MDHQPQQWEGKEERQALVAQKIESGINPSRVGRILGVSRQTVNRDLAQIGIQWTSEISQEDLVDNIIDIVHHSHECTMRLLDIETLKDILSNVGFGSQNVVCETRWRVP